MLVRTGGAKQHNLKPHLVRHLSLQGIRLSLQKVGAGRYNRHEDQQNLSLAQCAT